MGLAITISYSINKQRILPFTFNSSIHDRMYKEHKTLVKIGKVKLLGKEDRSQESDPGIAEFERAITNDSIEEVALNIQNWIVVGHLRGQL